MKICRIIGAGDCKSLNFDIQNEDLIIAADGGAKYLQKAGLKPDILIGDFDSLDVNIDSGEVIRLNPIKDITDMDAAVKIGIERGYTEFHLYGACGGRIEHTLANIQLVASLSQKNIKAYVHDSATVITALTDDSVYFNSSYKGYISVFSHTDKCTGVYLKGLKYPLENATLTNSFPLGVSNEFVGEDSEIKVENGTLILIYFDVNY